jgi:hypothetical protein
MQIVNFKGHRLEYKRSFRALREYEIMFGKLVTDIKGHVDLTNLMYVIVKTEAVRNGVEFNLTVDEFIDWLDDTPDALEGFIVPKEDTKTEQGEEKKT